MAIGKDLVGQTFGRLAVLEREGSYVLPNGQANIAMWRCRCACGAEHTAYAHHLRTGRTRSCGCLRREASRERLRARRASR
jgi:hypothetical protein